jgi:phosphatidylethanolamine-binding protein (PEBP) family uncharacterized protein
MGDRADSDFPGGDARRPVGMAKSPRRARQWRARARRSRVALVGVLAAGGTLVGCGGVSPTASSSSAQPLELGSPAITGGKGIPARYTCGGKDVSPPLKWGNVPANTAELALFLLDLSHTQSAGGEAYKASIKVGWAIHGLKPTLQGMVAGRLPAGAIAGHGRYSVCPPKGGTGEYMFRLYALSNPIQVKPGLSDLELFRRVNKESTAVGYFISEYKRS